MSRPCAGTLVDQSASVGQLASNKKSTRLVTAEQWDGGKKLWESNEPARGQTGETGPKPRESDVIARSGELPGDLVAAKND